MPYKIESLQPVAEETVPGNKAGRGPGTQMSTENSHDRDVRFIRALAELLRENDLTELQVRRSYGEHDSLKVRVSRLSPALAVQAAAVAPSSPVIVPSGMIAPPGGSQSDDPAAHPGVVTSPMVGTVYLQPEPGSQPFVTAGQTVKEGDTLLIIEAMKTMNQIPAPRAGTVRRILIEDGAPAEYGAPLMIIE
jgi:acetyl-CoA carboxylase biotin carboxyl carrier protein